MDPERFREYATGIFGTLGGAMTATMIYLGDHLGLYRALADGEPVSSEELYRC